MHEGRRVEVAKDPPAEAKMTKKGGGRGGGRNNNKGRDKGSKKGGSKGRGGQGVKRKSVPMPKELIGLESVTENGEPICFAYNLPGGCNKAAKWGENCSKGLHVCMKKGCKKHHAYVGNH